MRFLFIHGTGGGPQECWYPWLKEILEEKGHEVIVPQFPTPYNQNLDNWLTVVKPYWQYFDENLVLVGRSIGVPFVLRLLERSPRKIKAAFFVAGFYEDVPEKQFYNVVHSFVDNEFNWLKIKGNCEQFFVYHADDDPIVPLEMGEELAGRLNVRVQVIPHGEHLWFEKFPEILPGIGSLEKRA